MTGDKAEIEWLPNVRVAIENVSDPWNPMSGWLRRIQLGLRADGVLVWRRVEKDGQDDWPAEETEEPQSSSS